MTLSSLISANPRPNPLEKVRNLPISRQPKGDTQVANSTFFPNEIMYLEKEGSMYKQSYIQTNHVYSIPLSMLRPFSPQPFENRLSQESYKNLTTKLNITPSAWISTSDLDSGVQDPSIAAATFYTITKQKSSTQSSKKEKKPKAQPSATANEIQELKNIIRRLR